MGLEISGTIVKARQICNRIKLGEQVWALLNGGEYAEYVVIPEPQCMRVPNKVWVIDAARLPEVFRTVWTNLIDRISLRKYGIVPAHRGTCGFGFVAKRLAKVERGQDILDS